MTIPVRDGRGNCKKCKISAVCLSVGVEGLLPVIHAICAHCGKVHLRKNKKKAIDLDCGWFDKHYHRMTMRIKMCKECKVEIQEMLEITEGKTTTDNVWGSEVRRKK